MWVDLDPLVRFPWTLRHSPRLPADSPSPWHSCPECGSLQVHTATTIGLRVLRAPNTPARINACILIFRNSGVPSAPCLCESRNTVSAHTRLRRRALIGSKSPRNSLAPGTTPRPSPLNPNFDLLPPFKSMMAL